MSAPERLFILLDESGIHNSIIGDSVADLESYILGVDGERILEYAFVKEHPIDIDLQADPEGSE